MPSGIYNHKLSRPNYHPSAETKKKISIAKLGVPKSKEHIRNMSLSLRGMPSSRGMLGKKMSIETRMKQSDAHKGEKAYNWKGDNAGYAAIHSWVNKWKKRPDRCAACKEIKKLDWANKDHKYRKILEDYIALCKKCHRSYDKLRNANYKKQ